MKRLIKSLQRFLEDQREKMQKPSGFLPNSCQRTLYITGKLAISHTEIPVGISYKYNQQPEHSDLITRSYYEI